MKSIHALLVDDDKHALETMGLILEMDEFLVSKAESGRMALERLESAEEHPPEVDFLVVDLDMDNLSGIELLTEMRRRGHNTPVMVVTGFASKGTVVELLRQGVADFLDKPIHLEEFRVRVHRMANKALKRRRRAGSPPSAPPFANPVPSRSVTVMDLGNLGMPYALRRMIGAPERNHTVMACKKPHGFDILLADVRGADAESFYVSVLIKTFFDKHRAGNAEACRFLAALNQMILDGALRKQDIGALFLRIQPLDRRIEIHPAGFPSQCWLGLGGTAPRMLSFAGSPLGLVKDPGFTSCDLDYRRGDRLFILSEPQAPPRLAHRGADAESLRSAAGVPPGGRRLRESILTQEFGGVCEMAEGIWRNLRGDTEGGGAGGEEDPLLLGFELV
jgi:CheY-like chemotaxis protein